MRTWIITLLTAIVTMTAAHAVTLGTEAMPIDADVWRAAECGAGPFGGKLGTCLASAKSPEAWFAEGGEPYQSLCGRMVTKPAEACDRAELANHVNWPWLK